MPVVSQRVRRHMRECWRWLAKLWQHDDMKFIITLTFMLTFGIHMLPSPPSVRRFAITPRLVLCYMPLTEGSLTFIKIGYKSWFAESISRRWSGDNMDAVTITTLIIPRPPCILRFLPHDSGFGQVVPLRCPSVVRVQEANLVAVRDVNTDFREEVDTIN